jgi:hypothetical protein
MSNVALTVKTIFIHLCQLRRQYIAGQKEKKFNINHAQTWQRYSHRRRHREGWEDRSPTFIPALLVLLFLGDYPPRAKKFFRLAALAIIIPPLANLSQHPWLFPALNMTVMSSLQKKRDIWLLPRPYTSWLNNITIYLLTEQYHHIPLDWTISHMVK